MWLYLAEVSGALIQSLRNSAFSFLLVILFAGPTETFSLALKAGFCFVSCSESPFLLKVLLPLTAFPQILSVPSVLPSHSRLPGGTSPFLFVEPPAADLLT